VRHFKIPKENIICVGDETDQYFGSRYKKDPDAFYTPIGEIKATIERIQQWTTTFPMMKVCISNHGERWGNVASEAGIPSILLRRFSEVIGIPEGWVYRYEWRIPEKHPFRVIHGLGYSGQNAHRTAALDAGVSTAIGHLHSFAGVSYICNGFDPTGLTASMGRNVWGMNTGCLVNRTKFAFKYGRDHRHKPTLGTGVVVNNGASPIWVPYET
jgi:hypothetical protein